MYQWFQNNKASGLGALNQQLLDICNKTLNGGRPDIWVKNGIISHPKKSDFRSHRELSLYILNRISRQNLQQDIV